MYFYKLSWCQKEKPDNEKNKNFKELNLFTPGRNFIALLNSKHISVLTVAEKFA